LGTTLGCNGCHGADTNAGSFTSQFGEPNCSNASCHGVSAAPAVWGATLGCSGCHGGNAGSGSSITTGRHSGHINNSVILGSAVGCAACHAKTVSTNPTVSVSATHGNGFVGFSGVRAGKITSCSSATG
jgi:hypothetical protein